MTNDTDSESAGFLRNLIQSARRRLTGVEKSNRWYDRPHRINVVLETDREHNMSSHTDARAYKLTGDELRVERNARRLNENSWKSFERERIVKADVTFGETIVPENDSDQ